MKFLILFLFFAFPAFAQSQKSIEPKKTQSDTLFSAFKTELIEDDMPVDTSPVYVKYDPGTKNYYHTRVDITNLVGELPESLMIDSTMIDPHYLYYLAPNEVREVNIMKNPKGVLNVTLKNGYRALVPKILKSKLISITEIKNTYLDKADKNKQVIYLLNGDMLTDTANIKIPEICLLHVSVAKASETAYFKTAMPKVLIMIISTKYASSKPYHPNNNISLSKYQSPSCKSPILTDICHSKFTQSLIQSFTKNIWQTKRSFFQWPG